MAQETRLSHKNALIRGVRFAAAGAGATVAIAAFIFAVLSLAMASRPVLFVEVETNHAAFTVERSQLSVLALREAELIAPRTFCGAGSVTENGSAAASPAQDSPEEAGEERRSFTGRITPPTGATVEYFVLPGYVQINIRPGRQQGEILVETRQQNCRLAKRMTVLLPLKTIARNQPLPILGHLEVGQELGVPPRPDAGDLVVQAAPGLMVERMARVFIHGGRAEVFGRASNPFRGGQLYPVAESGFPIVRGSRIAVTEEEVAGNAMIQPGKATLNLQFTVSADALRMFRPGSDQQSEVIAVGAVARAFGDPTIAPVLVAFILASFILQLLFGFFGLFLDWRKGRS